MCVCIMHCVPIYIQLLLVLTVLTHGGTAKLSVSKEAASTNITEL